MPCKQLMCAGRGLVGALALTGCPQPGTVSWLECERVETPVADDVVVAEVGLSAADVLALVTGTFPFDAAYEAGGGSAGEIVLTRGVGSAASSIGTLVNHTAPSSTPGHQVLLLEVSCEPELIVPVDAALTTDDGLVALAVAGEATPGAGATTTAPVSVRGYVPAAEVDALPGTGAGATVSLRVVPQSSTVSVDVWWDGAERVLSTL